MELGRCPRCSTPYTSSEVTGFGILRGRSARQGGPRVEYTCQGCGALIRLVAHGEGRYAPPGQPPPRAVPREAQVPPWMQDGHRRRARAEAPPEPEPAPPPPEREHEPDRPADAADPATAGTAEEAPPAPAEALALLGVEPTADRRTIERAFRERSRTCHPDKVAHLDEDFQALAERKFRRLKQAYDLLMD